MSQDTNPAFLVDGIKSIAIHNDVVRVQFMQLDNNGNPDNTVCLMIPMRQVQQIADALRAAKR